MSSSNPLCVNYDGQQPGIQGKLSGKRKVATPCLLLIDDKFDK